MKKKAKISHAKSEMSKVSGGDSNNNDLGVAAVVMGIVSVLFGLTGAYLAPAAVILGIISLIFSRKQNKIQKNKWSIWGTWLSIIGIILGLLIMIFIVISQVNSLGAAY